MDISDFLKYNSFFVRFLAVAILAQNTEVLNAISDNSLLMEINTSVEIVNFLKWFTELQRMFFWIVDDWRLIIVILGVPWFCTKVHEQDLVDGLHLLSTNGSSLHPFFLSEPIHLKLQL